MKVVESLLTKTSSTILAGQPRAAVVLDVTVGPAVARVVTGADEPVLLVRAVASVKTRNLVTSGLGSAAPWPSVWRRTDTHGGGCGGSTGHLAARIANTSMFTLGGPTHVLAGVHISQADPVIT